MNMKKIFTMLSISLLILGGGSALLCMDEDPPAPSPGGTPFHLDCVPPKKGFWRLIGLKKRNKVYPMAAVAVTVKSGLEELTEIEETAMAEDPMAAVAAALGKGLRKDLPRVPTALAEMALADAGYHVVRTACNAARGRGGLRDEKPEAESRVDDSEGKSCRKAHHGKASHVEKAAALHGSRLAAYVLTQEIARRTAPPCADPDYEKNRRAMAEEASADLLWSSIKDLSRATGLTDGLKSCAARAAHAIGLDALPEGAQDIGKEVACAGLDLFGRALVKGSVVRPVSNRMVGEPEATGTRFGIGLQRSAEGGLSLRFDGEGASLKFEL